MKTTFAAALFAGFTQADLGSVDNSIFPQSSGAGKELVTGFNLNYSINTDVNGDD